MFDLTVHKLGAVIGVLLTCVIVCSSAAADDKSEADDSEPARTLLIEYEAGLEEVGNRLGEVLKIRLARFAVDTAGRELARDSEDVVGSFTWNVTLRRISEKHLIITVDSVDGTGAQEVRTVAHDREVEELAWTLGLVVEEAVTPYLETESEMPALGAGLAIIEPEVIGGTKIPEEKKPPRYPRFKSVGLALSLSGIWNINEILAGPHVIVKGIFSKHLLASIGVGWQGNADFGTETLSGTMSQIPIELLFGYMLLERPHFDVVGWTGFSLGFAVYKTHDENSGRTDMTFQPGFNLFLEIVVKIVSPWAVYIEGGCNFPFIRDMLVNSRVEIYNHVWVVPTISLGTALFF